MYVLRSTADILPKWKDMRSIADMPKSYEIPNPAFRIKYKLFKNISC